PADDPSHPAALPAQPAAGAARLSRVPVRPGPGGAPRRRGGGRALRAVPGRAGAGQRLPRAHRRGRTAPALRARRAGAPRALEQRRRFERDVQVRRARGAPVPPLDEALLDSLEAGLPACAGVALGIDRLLMAMLGTPCIADVLAFDFTRA